MAFFVALVLSKSCCYMRNCSGMSRAFSCWFTVISDVLKKSSKSCQPIVSSNVNDSKRAEISVQFCNHGEKEMMMKTTLIVLGCAVLLGSNLAQAREHGFGRDHHGPRQSYTQDSTRTLSDGRVFTRHTEQTVSNTGFQRNTTLTNPEGKTATRTVTGTRDPANKTYTRSVDGTTFSGKTYSRDTVTQKTSDGYTRETNATLPNGKTMERDVHATVDKQAGTLTRDISVTKPNGQVVEKTVVTTRTVDKP